MGCSISGCTPKVHSGFAHISKVGEASGEGEVYRRKGGGGEGVCGRRWYMGDGGVSKRGGGGGGGSLFLDLCQTRNQCQSNT